MTLRRTWQKLLPPEMKTARRAKGAAETISWDKSKQWLQLSFNLLQNHSLTDNREHEFSTVLQSTVIAVYALQFSSQLKSWFLRINKYVNPCWGNYWLGVSLMNQQNWKYATDVGFMWPLQLPNGIINFPGKLQFVTDWYFSNITVFAFYVRYWKYILLKYYLIVLLFI